MEIPLNLLLLTLLLSTATAHVVSMNPACKHYRADGHCDECVQRFYKDEMDICQPVSTHCRTYNHTNGHCLSCYEGYALIEDVCLPHFSWDPLCAKFISNKCVLCSSGCYFNQDDVCTQGDPNCKHYSKQICSECYGGYHLHNNSCVRELFDPNCNKFINGIC